MNRTLTEARVGYGFDIDAQPPGDRAAALRDIEGIRNRSMIQPMPSRPRVRNQIAPVMGLPK